MDVYVNAHHQGEEVQFCTMEDLVGNATILGTASRVLDNEELLLMSIEEPPTFAEAECDQQWRWAILKEIKAIEDNGTWELFDPPLRCRPIGLKWVFKVKRDECGAIVKHKARLVTKGFVQRRGLTLRKSLR